MNDLKYRQPSEALAKPSKSQRKREATALQDLAASLVDLKATLLKKLPLSDTLHQAILAARQLPQGSARKRQVQYIGKLMRQSDCTYLRTALDQLKGYSIATRQRQHQLQPLLHGLLKAEAENLTTFFHRYPQADRQHLRQLIRNASREKTHYPTPRSHRLLLKYLQEMTENLDS